MLIGMEHVYVLVICFASGAATSVPTSAPTLGVNLPPSLSTTFAPTTSFTRDETTGYQIKSIAIVFSLIGVLCFLMLIKFMIFYTPKIVSLSSNKQSKYELQATIDEQQELLADISKGHRKPDVAVQYEDGFPSSGQGKVLEVSWSKEHHFSMQYDNSISSGDKILVARPEHFVSRVSHPPATLTATKSSVRLATPLNRTHSDSEAINTNSNSENGRVTSPTVSEVAPISPSRPSPAPITLPPLSIGEEKASSDDEHIERLQSPAAASAASPTISTPKVALVDAATPLGRKKIKVIKLNSSRDKL